MHNWNNTVIARDHKSSKMDIDARLTNRYVCLRSMSCSRYPSPVFSTASTGLPVSSAHVAMSAFPAGIRPSIYRCTATGSGAPLSVDGFRMFILMVFIDHFAQLIRHMEAVEPDFSTALGKWVRAAFI